MGNYDSHFFDKYITMKLNELDEFNLNDAVSFHDELNHALYTGSTLKPEVRSQLLTIAEDFLEHLGVTDLDVEDITISGSNAAYSYTAHSDIDLHIIIDMSKLRDDVVYRELFDAKKNLYNATHDIEINGFEVELYVQDSNDPVISLGEYSVSKNKWIHLPRKRRANFDQVATAAKFNKLMSLAEVATKSKNLDLVTKVIQTIKKYRQAGLDAHGEFGPENLAYKAIRSRGVIQHLRKLLELLHSERLSLPESKMLNKPELTVEQLAKKHNVSRMHIAQQLDKGIKVELEHTTHRKVAREIALDHLAEDPDYYTKLDKAQLDENIEQIVYHVTPTRNIPSIMKRGLEPQIGSRSEKIDGEESGIYTFPDKVSAEDAVANWLGDEFDEDDELSLLALNISGLHTVKGADYEIIVKDKIEPSRIKVTQTMLEASGYIPSEKEKNDPRFKTALTVDVRPDSIKKNAKAFGFKTSRAGIPPLLR